MEKVITVPATELYDELSNKFINIAETKLVLKHSLVSLHKWEQKYKIPFLTEDAFKKTGPEGLLDYIKFMTISRNVDPNVYLALTEENLNEVMDYINDPMTATWFREDKEEEKNPVKRKRKKKEIITAEIIYWQMISLQIPTEYEKWHLNSLITLIRVCGIKNEEQYKESQKSTDKGRKRPSASSLKSRNALNAKRRAALHSKG